MNNSAPISENKNPPTEQDLIDIRGILSPVLNQVADAPTLNEVAKSIDEFFRRRLSTETEKAREEGRDKLIAFLEQRDYKLQPEHTLNELLHDYMERESARATKDK